MNITEKLREFFADIANEHSCETYHENCDCRSHIAHAIRTADLPPELREEIERMEKDGERLDLLDKHCDGADRAGYGSDDLWWRLIHHDGQQAEGATIREAIDAIAGKEARKP